MRPPEVLDHQASLYDYLDSAAYRGYFENYLKDMANKGKIALTGKSDYVDVLRASLRVAQPVHVSREMMPLLRAAAMDLEEDDHIVHSRLPAEHGFLMFDDPITIRDVWGQSVGMAAVHWRHGGATEALETGHPVKTAGVWLTFFTDLHDENDDVTQDLIANVGIDEMRTLGRLHVNHLSFLPYGHPVGPFERPAVEAYSRFATGDLSLAEATPNTERMIVALFRLLGQVIVDVSDAPIDRATVRRMTRKQLPVRVQTVKLRRKERPRGEEHGEGHVEWQHSWAVRGHWAWRKCGHDHPTAEEYEKGWRTRVYIAPYFKGPDDKPLKISEKVWGLQQ